LDVPLEKVKGIITSQEFEANPLFDTLCVEEPKRKKEEKRPRKKKSIRNQSLPYKMMTVMLGLKPKTCLTWWGEERESLVVSKEDTLLQDLLSYAMLCSDALTFLQETISLFIRL